MVRMPFSPPRRERERAYAPIHHTYGRLFMRVLVIGSGAREHAIVWKLAQSPRVTQLYAAPGNPGMTPYAERVQISVNQINELAVFAESNNIDLTIVGPEAPLIDGIVDVFQQRGLRIFGPNKAGAALERSTAIATHLPHTAPIRPPHYRPDRDH